jgi:hypothetical protein
VHPTIPSLRVEVGLATARLHDHGGSGAV